MDFRATIHADFMGAIDFLDENMAPTEKKLTIKNVVMQKPPNGGKEKICIYFEEDRRGAFLPVTQVKFIARTLRSAETTRWAGGVLLMTCAEVKAVGGGTTMGMRVKNAAFRAKKPAEGVTDVQS